MTLEATLVRIAEALEAQANNTAALNLALSKQLLANNPVASPELQAPAETSKPEAKATRARRAGKDAPTDPTTAAPEVATSSAAPDPAPTTVDSPAESPAPEATAPEATAAPADIEAVRTAARGYAAAGGSKEKVFEVLSALGCNKTLNELKEEHYSAAVRLLEAATAEANQAAA